MDSDRNDDSCEVGVELKYCEHCGALWVRERGAGVYCDKCRIQVADLPAPKKKPRRLRLPVAPTPRVEGYRSEISDDDSTDLESMGGVA